MNASIDEITHILEKAHILGKIWKFWREITIWTSQNLFCVGFC